MKKTASIILSAALAFSTVGALAADASAEWVKSSSGYSYKDDETGKKLTGWQTISGGKYYFDKKGVALTGWKKINGDTYYFNAAKRGRAVTSWVKIGGRQYYFGSDGVMRTGWIKISGKTYYFGTDGVMRTGKRKINGKVYDFGTNGVLKTASQSDSSGLTLPLKGLDWGMSMDEVTSALDNEDYLVLAPTLVVYSTSPYNYYLFDDSEELCAYGYMTDYSSADLKKFKGYFEDAGWELEYTAKNDSYVLLYTSGDNVGAVVYDSEVCMTMMLSDSLMKDIENGSVSDIADLVG